MNQREFKGISERAQKLLKGQEGHAVDFKQEARGIEPEDLVAFANSKAGGVILIGVEETKTEQGVQRGRIIGCPVGDREKQIILGKARSCVPPVEVDIYIENASRCPFFRIEVPGGKDKPYSTSKGTYVIRGDGRNLPLQPQELLTMFLSRETDRFFDYFSGATQELERYLDSIKDEVQSIQLGISSMEPDIFNRLERIYDRAENAESLADEAMNTSDENRSVSYGIMEKVENIEGTLSILDEATTDILSHFGLEHPRIKALRRNISMGAHLFGSIPDTNKEQVIEKMIELHPRVSKDFIKECVNGIDFSKIEKLRRLEKE